LKALAEAAGSGQHKEGRQEAEGMRRKIKQYLPALLLYAQRRLEGGRDAVISVRTRDICSVDRRCRMAVYMLMTSLVVRGLARRLKRGTYLIERRDAEEVLTALRQWI
jgi:predicted transcriptional regulator of viral defense system